MVVNVLDDLGLPSDWALSIVPPIADEKFISLAIFDTKLWRCLSIVYMGWKGFFRNTL